MSKIPSEETRDLVAAEATAKYVRLHSSIGWWSLVLFVTLGIALEALHGFKVSWYVNVGDETRRLLWRLAHAHGTFLGLIHIAFTVVVKERGGEKPVWRLIASRCFIGASVAVPAGFLLGGAKTYGGDPGLGIALLPPGAAMLWIALVLTALGWPCDPAANTVKSGGKKKRTTDPRKK
ncbi:MAG: hypothetical protein KDB27_24525 [Planctomycetales bacterium]|nr:hypothetical protein [Planctomycetales bacterium]